MKAKTHIYILTLWVVVLVGLFVYDDIQFVLSNIDITHNMHGIDYFYALFNFKPLILGMSSWA
jgi:hypothetical protein